jgi:hypothetical protein
MAKTTGSKSVPKSMQPNYDAITALTDRFCRNHLEEEYRELARRMTAALCRKRPSPLTSGQPRTWACGIVYVLGQINFLSDRATQPYMTTADLCARFGVGQSTASAKARVISQALDTRRLNPEWSLPSLFRPEPIRVDGRGQRNLGGLAQHATRGPGDRVSERHNPLYPG